MSAPTITACATSAPAVVLRPETAADEPFLRALFASTRSEELAALPPELHATFCDQQFVAQRRGYRERYPDGSFDVIEVDGVPVGRLCVDRAEVDTIVDVAVLPEHRGRGIAGAVLRPVLDAAAASGRVVVLRVVEGNPAADWYTRLGFEPIGRDGVAATMQRRPTGATTGGER